MPAAGPPVPGTLAVAAAVAGNTLEWFDFTVYVGFSIYIAKAFFPAENELASMLSALVTSGVGFLARPIGAVVLGQYADRAGRRAALTLIIFLMSIGCAMIAFTPTYAEIGIAAPASIVLARLIQGFSVGGEMGGATAYLIEVAPANRRGLYASWQYAGQAGASLGGALLGLVLTASLGTQAVYDWGWRVPFILGLAIAPIGLYLRAKVPETPVFLKERRPGRAPLAELLRDHRGALLAAFCLTTQLTACTYLLLIYMPAFAMHALGVSDGTAFRAASAGSLVYLVMSPVAGRLSDAFGRPRQMLAAALALAVLVYPAYLLMSHQPTALVLTGVSGVMAMLIAMFNGPSAAQVGEMFPPSVRSTGISLSYNLAVPIFGGFAPYFVTRLDTGSHLAPAWYMIACALPTLATLLWMGAARPRG
jgi:MHS family proline/betaine transporter-like MFS transporter